MASLSRIGARLRSRTALDEFKTILVGLGDNVLQRPRPRPRVRRSAPATPRGLLIADGGVPGMIFRDPTLYPVLLVSDDLLRLVMGPGAVVDRPPGWEMYSAMVPFDKRAAERRGFDLHHLFALLALAGAAIVVIYAVKHFVGERQRRLRLRRGGDLGSGRQEPDGPGPSGGWRFDSARGFIDLVGTGAPVVGPCGRGGRRFAQTLGLLDLVLGGGDGGGGTGASGGGERPA